MNFTLQIVLAVFCLPLTALGLKSMFAPASMTEDLAVTPDGPAGLNTIRGVVGGLFLATVAMIGLGLGLNDTTYFVAAALAMWIPAVGRVVGIAVDGFDKAVVRPLVAEVVIGATLVAAHIVLGGGA